MQTRNHDRSGTKGSDNEPSYAESPMIHNVSLNTELRMGGILQLTHGTNSRCIGRLRYDLVPAWSTWAMTGLSQQRHWTVSV